MYHGYLTLQSTTSAGAVVVAELVNNHRVQEYAKNAGIYWVHQNSCQPIGSVLTQGRAPYVLPNNDAIKPPWWDAGDVRGSEEFLGLMGVEFSGVDDSTRVIEVNQSLYRGGSLGRMREATREFVVSGIMVATSETGMALGKRWLRGVDGQVAGCMTNEVYLYEACPCVCEPDCSDPACQDACIQRYYRLFKKARITRGPEFMSTQQMSVGWMTQVQFTITAADPAIYGAPIAVLQPSPDETPDDGPEWTHWVQPLIPPPLARPITAPRFVPELTMTNTGGDVRDIQVFFRAGTTVVHDIKVPVIAPGETIKVDYAARLVTLIDAQGESTVLPGFVTRADGTLMFWPALNVWQTELDYDVEMVKPATSAAPVLGGSVLGRWL